MRKLYNFLILVGVLITLSNQHLTAQCMTTAGQLFQFSATDHNGSPDYTDLYILTDYSGEILQISDKTEFVIPEHGLFKVFSINYQILGGIYNVIVGRNYNDITGGCFEIGSPLEVMVCSALGSGCDIFDGHFSFNSEDANPALFTVYVLTNLEEEILQVGTVTQFDNIPVGEYLIFPINYVSIDGLKVGNHIKDITGSCFDIGNPLMLGSCEPCSVNLGNDKIVCENQTVSLIANANTQGTYTWNTGQIGSSIVVTPKVTTTYSVTFRSDLGCIATDTVLVIVQPIPEVNVGPDKIICEGQSVVISIDTVPGVTYHWSTGDTTRMITVSPSVTTSYSIRVDLGICSAEDEIKVIVNPLPDATIEGRSNICKGESTILEAKGGDSYLWNTGVITASITVAPDNNTSYTVTVTSAQGCSSVTSIIVYTDKCGKIGNFVWDDLNGNGLQEEGEPGIAGVEVILFEHDIQIASTLTDDTGKYLFEGLSPSTYKLKFVPPTGFIATYLQAGNDDHNSDVDPVTGFTREFLLEDQEIKLNIFAGYLEPGQIGHLVWEDINSNGIQDANEPGIMGVEVHLNGVDGVGQSVQRSILTDLDGKYHFEDIYPGTYTLNFVINDDYKVSPKNMGGDDSADSDLNPDKKTDPILIISGFKDLSVDAGFYRCGKLIGHVWIDKGSKPNIYDAEDEDLDGVDVLLFSTENPNVPLQSTKTGVINAQSGRYAFEICKPGYYYVKVIRPQDYKFVSPFAGDGTNDSKIKDSIAGITDSFYIGYAHLLPNINAGLVYSPLVVTLLDFTGYWDTQKDVNILKWRTTSEINNDFFELERSYEMEPFTKIATIKGQGNSTQVHDYRQEDPDIYRNGMYSYRLKQVDFDGQFTYSNVVKIPVFREINGFTTVLYPNPTTDNSTLEIHSNKGIKIRVEIFDGVGRLCYPFVFNSVLAEDVVRIPLEKLYLPKGMYHIKVSSDDQVSTLKWIIVK